MDAFFASVEELDNPALRGKPVIVGGGAEQDSTRGVVCAASYAARAFGVRSAMPLWQARRLCPCGCFVPTRKERYSEISRQVMSILGDFSPLVEQASVDEAYLDASGLEHLFTSVETMALQIKKNIKDSIGLTCSVGIAPIKFLAKIASDVNKPDGLYCIYPDDVAPFLATLPVGRIPGVGKRMLASLEIINVHTAGDVLRYSQAFWEQRFGKAGTVLYARAQGCDAAKVTPLTPPKSESAENTFASDTRNREELRHWLLMQSERVGMSLRKHKRSGRTITLKVKFSDFKQITRSHTLSEATNSTQTIFEEACALLDALELPRAVRLIGVGVSGFDGAVQMSLPLVMETGRDTAKRQRLDAALDAVRNRFGTASIVRGNLLGFDDS